MVKLLNVSKKLTTKKKAQLTGKTVQETDKLKKLTSATVRVGQAAGLQYVRLWLLPLLRKKCHSSYCRAVRIDILLLHKEGENLCKEISRIYLYRCSYSPCFGAGASPDQNRDKKEKRKKSI